MMTPYVGRQLSAQSVKKRAQKLVKGEWRPASSPTDDVADLVPLLIRTGVGALAWWRLRASAPSATPALGALRQTYRMQALHARLHEDRITLEKTAWTAPEDVKIEGPDDKALVYRGGETIEWKVVGS